MGGVVRRAVVVVAAVALACLGAPSTGLAYDELSVTLSGTPDRLIMGDVAMVKATIKNVDPLDRTGGQVQLNVRALGEDPDQLPTMSGPGCSTVVPPNLTCFIPGELPPGGKIEHTVTVVSGGAGEVVIQAGASAEVGEQFPPVMLTSSPVEWRRPVEATADTKLELTATPTQPRPNDAVTVRALVTNTTADGIAYGSAVRFSIPAGVEVVDKPTDCTGTALSLSCPVGDLGPQTSRDRIITVRSATEGSFAILSSVIWARPDTTPIDTQAQVSISVVSPPPDPEPTPKPTGPPKPVNAKPGTLAQGLPLSGRCVRSRRISFVLRSIRAFDPVLASIRITGRKRAILVKGRRALEPISIPLPRRRGRVLLRLEVKYDSGKTYKTSRAFRRC